LIVGLAAAVAPAVRTSRMDASSNLRPRVTGGSRAARASSVLITAQIALAFMLLSVATLLSRDFLQLRYFDLGYDPRGLFGTSLSTQGPEWLHPDPWKSVVAETRARVAAIPGIVSASLDYESAIHPSVVHSDRVAESQLDRNPRVKAVSPDYFKTWKNPVLLGRAFAATDRAGAPLVAIVNRACASAFWPGMNPLGRRVFLGDSASGGEWLTVVGVTEDVEGGYYRFRHGLVVYRPFEQARLYHASVTLYVRPVGDRPAPLASVQSVIRQVTGQRGAPFVNEDERIDTRYRPRRFNAIALDVFAGFGLLLAAMGIYGSIAFAVAQRTREIGIRVALGAERSNVLSLVARRGVIIAAVGASLGVAGSVALTRVFRSFVSATNAGNPWIVGASVVVVVVVALIATFLPARRATDVSPVIALRAD
jgi:predicted permease